MVSSGYVDHIKASEVNWDCFITSKKLLVVHLDLNPEPLSDHSPPTLAPAKCDLKVLLPNEALHECSY